MYKLSKYNHNHQSIGGVGSYVGCIDSTTTTTTTTTIIRNPHTHTQTHLQALFYLILGFMKFLHVLLQIYTPTHIILMIGISDS